MRSFLTALIILACTACSAPQETLQWQPVSYESLTGWKQDRQAETLQSFVRSCGKPKKGRPAIAPLIDAQAWKQACLMAEQWPAGDSQQAQAFFEQYFTPYRLSTNLREQGLLTGYYIPVFAGSLTKTDQFKWPVYGLPNDIVAKKKYFSRAEIDSGALAGKRLEIAWVEDPVMLFFLHIQGSGRLQLPDGSMADLRYAGKNNQAYVAIGKVLVERGEMEKSALSMQSIRQWLYDYPDQAAEVMQQNPSYVFFTLSDAETLPPGAQQVPLTPERSLAIDAKQLPYGLPVFIEAQVEDKHQMPHGYRRLLVTQDTGGAIKGPLRGDIFFGQGDDAEWRAGGQNYPGRWTVLIPTSGKTGHAQ